MESADAPGAGTPGAQELRSSVDRSLGRASDAALRTGNRLTLLQNGTETYEKWLEEIRRAARSMPDRPVRRRVKS